MLAAELFAQIDDADFGERAILYARSQLQQVIFSRARVVIGLERRRRGAEERYRAFELRAIDRCVASVIAWRFFLFVARFLFLIHDNQADVFERRENGGARADDNFRFAMPHAPPLAGA